MSTLPQPAQSINSQPSLKPTNPKDAVGIGKIGMSCIPANVLGEVSLGMAEGARKYGRHNYRVIGIRSSVYYDATMRHLLAWWEGEDIDPDSGLSHITKAITSLVVLRDAQIQHKENDDRPPKSPDGWMHRLNIKARALLIRYPEDVLPYTNESTKNDKPQECQRQEPSGLPPPESYSQRPPEPVVPTTCQETCVIHGTESQTGTSGLDRY